MPRAPDTSRCDSWLRRSFIHVRGIGRELERRLWEFGATDWDSFRTFGRLPGIGSAKRGAILEEIARSEAHLSLGDVHYFAERLPPSEAWRLWPDFRERAVFLDIETNGAPPGEAITVVGIYDGVRAEIYVRGVNLDELPKALERFDVWITYNGRCFDEAYLVEELGERVRPAAHIDLMYGLRRVGLRGGLKVVEACSGFRRPDRLQGLSGWDAVRLWNEYISGRPGSLRLLAEYNLVDTVSLEFLLGECARRHAEKYRTPFKMTGDPGSPTARSAAVAEALARLGAITGLW